MIGDHVDLVARKPEADLCGDCPITLPSIMPLLVKYNYNVLWVDSTMVAIYSNLGSWQGLRGRYNFGQYFYDVLDIGQVKNSLKEICNFFIREARRLNCNQTPFFFISKERKDQVVNKK